MNQPAYLSSVNIRCIGGCSQIIKSNGVAIMSHTVLNHKYSPGETALICRKCRANFNRMEGLTGQGGNWMIGETIEVARPAAEYEEPLLRALRIFDKAMQPESFTYTAQPETFTEQTETI